LGRQLGRKKIPLLAQALLTDWQGPSSPVELENVPRSITQLVFLFFLGHKKELLPCTTEDGS